MPPFKIPFPQAPGPQATNIAGAGPTDNPDIWEALRPMLAQAMQGMTQEREPAESLYFPTQNRQGEQTFFGRHPKIRRSLEMGLHQFTQPLPPGAPAEAFIARGLGTLSGYDQARQDKAYESSNQRFARLDPLLNMADRFQKGALASAQTAHFESLADRPQPFQIGAPGASVITRGGEGQPQFTTIPGEVDRPGGGTQIDRTAALILEEQGLAEPTPGQQLEAVKTATNIHARERAVGGGFGRQAVGGLSERERNWVARRRTAGRARSKKYVGNEGMFLASRLQRKYELDRTTAQELVEYLASRHSEETENFIADNNSGTFDKVWTRMEKDVIAEFLEGESASGYEVGEIVEVEGQRLRITAINEDGSFEFEPAGGQ